MLVVLGGGDNTKVLDTDPLFWELSSSEFSDIFEMPGAPPNKAIKHEVELLPNSVPPAKR